jgi:hypothetical protein
MGEMTPEELSAMTDQELLAYQREHHGDPYMTLVLLLCRHPVVKRRIDEPAKGRNLGQPASSSRS